MTTLDPHSAPASLAAFLEEARRVVDADLARRLAPPADDPGRLGEAMCYAATGPGKRLRPAIVLAAAEACGASRETCASLGRYGLAIGIAFQHADDRDDAELLEHAAAAAARMRTLCEEARSELQRSRLVPSVLDELAAWIASRA